MKAVIYAGIGLFSIASVYGIADYYNTSKNGSLKEMYQEEVTELIVAKTPIITPYEETAETVTVDKRVIAKTVKKQKSSAARSIAKKKVRKIRFDDFSRGRIMPTRILEEEIIQQPAPVVDTKIEKKEL